MLSYQRVEIIDIIFRIYYYGLLLWIVIIQ